MAHEMAEEVRDRTQGHGKLPDPNDSEQEIGRDEERLGERHPQRRDGETEGPQDRQEIGTVGGQPMAGSAGQMAEAGVPIRENNENK